LIFNDTENGSYVFLEAVEQPAYYFIQGDNLDAEAARAKGLLDEVVASDAVDAALALIARVRASAPKRRTSAFTAELGIVGLGLFATPYVVAQAHKLLPAEENGGLAAHKLVDAVEASIELDFPRGVAREYRLFDELVRSASSAALRHVFFAERELGKIPGSRCRSPAPASPARARWVRASRLRSPTPGFPRS